MGRGSLFLFFLSLICAFVIKFAVHEQKQLSERVVEAQVSYGQAAEGMISYELQESVKVSVRGPSSDISRLAPFTVEVLARIPKGRPGPREIVLETEDVRFNVPGDFETLSLEPNRFTIQVEERLQKTLPIRVVFSGEPAAGSRQSQPVARPSEALVAGPRSKVERLVEVTATVNLDGHARSFEESVPVASSDPLVKVVRPTIVTVSVPMEEPELSINFGDFEKDEER